MTRMIFMEQDEQIPIGIKGVVIYCNKAGKNEYNPEICDKCLLHGYHTMVGYTQICKAPKDWKDDGYEEFVEEQMKNVKKKRHYNKDGFTYEVEVEKK